jgi:hypothetical protein
MFKPLSLVVAMFLLSCVTPVEQSEIVNGVMYLKTKEPFLSDCVFLDKVVGIPDTVFGGSLHARIDALQKAEALNATHFLETNHSWVYGDVAGVAYVCSGGDDL